VPDRGLEHHQEIRIMTCALALSSRFITGMSPELVFFASLAVVTLRPLRFKILDNLGKGQTRYRKDRKA
jgi:hypothetical protein